MSDDHFTQGTETWVSFEQKGWLDLMASLEALEKSKIACSSPKSEHDSFILREKIRLHSRSGIGGNV
jgi:hypothetical protein